jgi:alkylation response protein AidB-like acyl-CoA dehydrogenase
VTDYRAPVPAIRRALRTVGIDDVLAQPDFDGVGFDDALLAVEEFGRFAAEVIAPTNRIGDTVGARFDPADGTVTMPPEITKAYRGYVETGWGALAAPAAEGGGGMPTLVGLVVAELFASANMALSLNPTLTHGAIDLLANWGTDTQRATYLPKLITGEWNGTMNLTEPDAGSDLGAVRTRASRNDDGTWAVTGSKIFITWGDHDTTDNVVHLVLARTVADAVGTRGLSLFVVPKFLVGADGSLGERNAVTCVGIEHKLGIHASPTCTLDFDAATGELVGEEGKGMAAMFTMMNAARLQIGLQGLAVAERAYQAARAFADERVQGRTVTGAATIVGHPDVRRMLLTMATGIDAMRLLLYRTAAATDLAHHHADDAARADAQALVEVLTPIAKAWSTDEGVRLTSLAVQVFGGMGYVEETGIAQLFRDARIAPIYEGTNGIQAIDLVGRKILRDGGAAIGALIADLRDGLAALDHLGERPAGTDHAIAAVDALEQAVAWLLAHQEDQADWLAAATPFLDLAALAVAAGFLARHAAGVGDDGADPVAIGRFSFFALERASAAPGLLVTIEAGANRLDPALL